MWTSGSVVTLRYRALDGSFYSGRPVRVVSDTGELLVTYMAAETICSMPVFADGRELRDVSLDERWVLPRAAVRRPWSENELVQLFPRGRAHSLWIVRDPAHALVGWYVNLEDPQVLGDRTITTNDHILDIWVPAETGEPEWKDEHELAAALAQGRVSVDKAAAIRAEGERVWAERPWPTGWDDWRPPAEWTPPELPEGWDAEPPDELREGA
jgi:hypothetical protein